MYNAKIIFTFSDLFALHEFFTILRKPVAKKWRIFSDGQSD